MQIRQKATKPEFTCGWQKPAPQRDCAGELLRVLIADDESFARAALAMLLKNEAGFQVVGSVGDGPETVQAIRALRPDVLFLDVRMPGLDGFEVLERAGRPRHMAVIFTTSDEKIGPRAFDVDALDYLLKPYTRARFRVALDRARERFQAKRAVCSLPHFGN